MVLPKVIDQVFPVVRKAAFRLLAVFVTLDQSDSYHFLKLVSLVPEQGDVIFMLALLAV